MEKKADRILTKTFVPMISILILLIVLIVYKMLASPECSFFMYSFGGIIDCSQFYANSIITLFILISITVIITVTNFMVDIKSIENDSLVSKKTDSIRKALIISRFVML